MLSALVICQNEAARLKRCLKSLSFCDEIVVVDGGGTDNSVAIAEALGGRVFRRPYIGTNDQKEFARQQARGEWVLNIDADEWVSSRLAEEIRAAVRSGKEAGYRLPVRTRVGGVWLKTNGYWPGWQKRLFRRDAGRWDASREPHDHVFLDGRWSTLRTPIEHDTAANLDELEAKALRYGRMAKEKRAARGLWPTRLQRVARPVWRFLRSYVFKGGFFAGRLGLRLALIHYREGAEKYRLDGR